MATRRVAHDFGEDLARSEREASREWWWFMLYEQAFCDDPRQLIETEFVTDAKEQRLGRDRKLTFADGTVEYADEKDHWNFPECMELEVWSSVERRTPGWVLGHKRVDWLTWVVRPTRQAYLFPYAALCAAYHENKHEWKYLVDLCGNQQTDKHRVRDAANKGWTTRFLVVPLDEMCRLVRPLRTAWEYG